MCISWIQSYQLLSLFMQTQNTWLKTVLLNCKLMCIPYNHVYFLNIPKLQLTLSLQCRIKVHSLWLLLCSQSCIPCINCFLLLCRIIVHSLKLNICTLGGCVFPVSKATSYSLLLYRIKVHILRVFTTLYVDVYFLKPKQKIKISFYALSKYTI